MAEEVKAVIVDDNDFIDWKRKLSSRKFWFAVAAFLYTMGTGILAIADVIPEKALVVVIVGNICIVLAAGIYSFCEALVDGKRVSANTTSTTLSANATSKEIVQAALKQEVTATD